MRKILTKISIEGKLYETSNYCIEPTVTGLNVINIITLFFLSLSLR